MLISSILHKRGADFKSFLVELRACLQGLDNPGRCGVLPGRQIERKEEMRACPATTKTNLTEHRTWALAGILPFINRNDHKAARPKDRSKQILEIMASEELPSLIYDL